MRDALGRLQRVLVLGGGSDIARATLHALLAEGPLTVVLAARRPDELRIDDLERAGATVQRVRFDARATETHAAVVEEAFRDDVDLVLVAFGVLGDQEAAERDAAAALEILEANLVGAVSALTHVAQRLRAQGHGAVVVLSSIAALRARRSNYVYGASKAGLDAFAQGLRLALEPDGVRVLIVRPGYVRTKLTAGRPPTPLSATPEQVGAAIARALRGDGRDVWVPPAWRPASWLLRLLPTRVLRTL